MSNQPLGLELEPGVLIAFTTNPFSIFSSKILKPDFIKLFVASFIIKGFRKSGLSVPYKLIESLYFIILKGGFDTKHFEFSEKISNKTGSIV